MQRIRSFDLARGLTVLMIAPIHTVLVYSKPEVRETWLGYILGFIAEGPGAQLFMLLMGIYVAFQQPKNLEQITLRSALLLLAGVALNALKFSLPIVLNLLPRELLNDLGLSGDANGIIQSLLIGDILQFASIALFIIQWIRRYPHYEQIALGTAIAVCFLSPFVWDSNNNYTIELFWGKPPRVFFPVFPWLVFPLVGLFIGAQFKEFSASEQQTKNNEGIFKKMFVAGIACLLAGFLLRNYVLQQQSESFYRTFPGDTIIHLGIVLITLSCWRVLDKKIPKNLFFDLLQYCSRHITIIYLIQWPIIMWLIPLLGYHDLNLFESIVAIVVISSITFAFLLLFIDIKKKYANKKNI